jgi:hypothetical protein
MSTWKNLMLFRTKRDCPRKKSSFVCRKPFGTMDFKALEYKEEMIKKLTQSY